jgi:hypothetical protein
MRTDLASEYDTLKARCDAIIRAYRDRWPKLHQNYTLVLLLVLRDFDRVWIAPDVLEKAARGELTNLTSLHRALTQVKKRYESPEDRAVNLTREMSWRELFAGGIG